MRCACGFAPAAPRATSKSALAVSPLREKMLLFAPLSSLPVLKLLTHPLKPRAAIALACVAGIVGLLSISPVALQLVGIWRTDDLKSMGLVVPFVCAALILRAWRQIGWRAEGSW